MNGLAIVIFAAQLTAFTECDRAGADVHTDCAAHTWLTLGLVALTMGLMLGLPRRCARLAELVPPSLVAIVLGARARRARALFRLGGRSSAFPPLPPCFS